MLNTNSGSVQSSVGSETVLQYPEDLFLKSPYKGMIISAVELKPMNDLEHLKKKAEEKFKATSEGVSTMFEGGTSIINKKTGTDAYDIANSTLLISIGLPLPNNLSELQEHSWSEQTGLAKDIADMIPSKLGQSYSRITDSMNVQKVTVNPSFYQDYESSKPRFFQFRYELMPNNQSEANTIVKIIKTLKAFSAPMATALSPVLVAPTYFRVDFLNGVVHDMIRARPMVITNIEVDYGASGFIETTYDGMPKALQLNISMKEKEAMSFGDWITEKVM